MTPADIAAILVRLDAQGKTLERIEEQAIKTNGRVTALERASIARDAAAAATAEIESRRRESRKWVPGSATAVGLFAAGVVVERFL